MKASLETKAKALAIVIRKNKAIDIDKIKAYCEMYFERYAFIVHEKDISTIDMAPEPIHYHIVGEAKERKRLSTQLNNLVNFFEFDSPFGIEIDKANCLEAMYQYLLHKNDKDKTPHEIKEIITNIPVDELQTIIDCDTQGGISVDRLWQIVADNVRLKKASEQIYIYGDYRDKIAINRREIAKAIGLGRIPVNSKAIDWAIADRINELFNGIL